MVCRYCGKPIAGTVCASCNKQNVLSYTSYELDDILGKSVHSQPLVQGQPVPNRQPDQSQLQYAFEKGVEEGKKHGYAFGYDTAKKNITERNNRQRRLLIISIASGAVILAVVCSLVFGKVNYTNGYSKGMIAGKQEQQAVDDALISESKQSVYQTGHDQGYDEGYQKGYDAGFEAGKLVTPTPSPEPAKPTPTPTPTITPAAAPTPFALGMKSKGEEVRQLQKRLIELGYLASNEADGDFGTKTKKAVEIFQRKNGLKTTGIVDQSMWNLIMSPDANPFVIQTISPTNVATDIPVPAKEEEITIIPETSPSSTEEDIEQAISTVQPDSERMPEPEVFEGAEV